MGEGWGLKAPRAMETTLCAAPRRTAPPAALCRAHELARELMRVRARGCAQVTLAQQENALRSAAGMIPRPGCCARWVCARARSAPLVSSLTTRRPATRMTAAAIAGPAGCCVCARDCDRDRAVVLMSQLTSPPLSPRARFGRFATAAAPGGVVATLHARVPTAAGWCLHAARDDAAAALPRARARACRPPTTTAPPPPRRRATAATTTRGRRRHRRRPRAAARAVARCGVATSH